MVSLLSLTISSIHSFAMTLIGHQLVPSMNSLLFTSSAVVIHVVYDLIPIRGYPHCFATDISLLCSCYIVFILNDYVASHMKRLMCYPTRFVFVFVAARPCKNLTVPCPGVWFLTSCSTFVLLLPRSFYTFFSGIPIDGLTRFGEKSS